MSFTTIHPVSGEPLTIENPLTAKHIKVGALLWYWGFTSTCGWDCPALITQVDEKRRRFKVRSLDDMREQNPWYSFGCTRNSDSSRQTMRVASVEEVRIYLEKRRVHLIDLVKDAKIDLSGAEFNLTHFDEFAASIIP